MSGFDIENSKNTVVENRILNLMYVVPFWKDLIAPKEEQLFLDYICPYGGMLATIICHRNPSLMSDFLPLLSCLFKTRLLSSSRSNRMNGNCKKWRYKHVTALLQCQNVKIRLLHDSLRGALQLKNPYFFFITPYHLDYIQHRRIITPDK